MLVAGGACAIPWPLVRWSMYETWLIVALSMLYGALLALALSKWLHRPCRRPLDRWLWLAIILIFSLAGPLAYLLLENDRPRRGIVSHWRGGS